MRTSAEIKADIAELKLAIDLAYDDDRADMEWDLQSLLEELDEALAAEPVPESVEVPFVKIGDRRGLTALQVREMPWLADFIKRFPDSFEPSVTMDVWLFVEPVPDKHAPTGGLDLVKVTKAFFGIPKDWDEGFLP
jgi:hypothetical protein